jgi:hypothetical protein
VRRQGFKGKGSGAKEDPSPASDSIIVNGFTESQRKNLEYFTFSPSRPGAFDVPFPLWYKGSRVENRDTRR